MNFNVRYSRSAREDLRRLYGFLLENDIDTAQRAKDAITKTVDLLKLSPFSCRKADPSTPFLRELVISFGSAGYVALFEIENQNTVTILAIRHQREEDYH